MPNKWNAGGCICCEDECSIDSDNFAREDESSVTGWTEEEGDWEISNNQLVTADSDAQCIFNTVNPDGNANLYALVTFSVEDEDDEVLLMIGWADSSTYLAAKVIVNSSCGSLELYSGATQLGDTIPIGNVEPEEVHTLTVCYSDETGLLSAKVIIRSSSIGVRTVWQAEAADDPGGDQVGVATGSITTGIAFNLFTFSHHADENNPGCPECPDCELLDESFPYDYLQCYWDERSGSHTVSGSALSCSDDNALLILDVPVLEDLVPYAPPREGQRLKIFNWSMNLGVTTVRFIANYENDSNYDFVEIETDSLNVLDTVRFYIRRSGSNTLLAEWTSQNVMFWGGEAHLCSTGGILTFHNQPSDGSSLGERIWSVGLSKFQVNNQRKMGIGTGTNGDYSIGGVELHRVFDDECEECGLACEDLCIDSFQAKDVAINIPSLEDGTCSDCGNQDFLPTGNFLLESDLTYDPNWGSAPQPCKWYAYLLSNDISDPPNNIPGGENELDGGSPCAADYYTDSCGTWPLLESVFLTVSLIIVEGGGAETGDTIALLGYEWNIVIGNSLPFPTCLTQPILAIRRHIDGTWRDNYGANPIDCVSGGQNISLPLYTDDPNGECTWNSQAATIFL